MAELLASAREGLVDAGAQLARAGLVPGTSGNLSVRSGDRVAITPRGVACGALRAQLIAVHSLAGSVLHAPLAPSSELPLHLAVYAATTAAAVVHTHSPAAVAVSTLVQELPPIHYYIASLGPAVRVAPYAPFGSAELAEGAVHALRDSSAALLANHGAVTVGPDLAGAVEAALTLEWLCEVYLRAASAGTPRVLDEHELLRARADLAAYSRLRRAESEQRDGVWAARELAADSVRSPEAMDAVDSMKERGLRSRWVPGGCWGCSSQPDRGGPL